MIHVTCFRCRRRFELDPVWVGVELRRLKTRAPRHFQAVCPGCHALNKVSVNEMRKDLAAVSDEIEAALAAAEQPAPVPEDGEAKTPA